MKQRTQHTLVIVAAAYVVLSTMIYRFKHPDKTETELFLEIPKALLWR